PEYSAVFHCRGCWAVLSDSLKLCAQEDRDLRAVVCCRQCRAGPGRRGRRSAGSLYLSLSLPSGATDEVIWKDSLMVGLEGALKGCAYYGLSCRSCGLAVGIILYSTPRRLACLRGLFCFFKDYILCYFLKTQMVIEASLVKFPAVTIKD
ncbi:MS18B protein, partial [Centropus bengalensis]|nr:MS18B protein [Centropus bengalensis]